MDHLALRQGRVPWSADGYLETLAWLAALRRTPADDWDLRDRGARVDPFRVTGQLYRHLLRRYGGRGRHHLFRLVQVQDFLHDHRAALFRDGLACAAEDDSARVSYHLLQALCELPYSRARTVRGESGHTFDYAEVRARARRLARTALATVAAQAR